MTTLDLKETRGDLCEWCQVRVWSQKHHAIMRRDKRFPQFDVEENYMCVCPICHDSGVIDSHRASVLFYFVQICRGYDMETWLLNLPCKIKPNFSRYQCNLDVLSQRVNEPLMSLVQEQIFG